MGYPDRYVLILIPMSICVNSAGEDVQVFVTVQVVEVHTLKCQFFGDLCSCRLLAFANTLKISGGGGTQTPDFMRRFLSPSH